jgi:transcriptional regulator with XRE-family HTH domain
MSETPYFSDPASAPFARRFRLLMGWHDLTLREIASSTHHALSTVGTWKNGRVPASRETIERLADIFHVPVEYLLTGEVSEGRVDADDTAGRILHDLDLLSRALAHGGCIAREKAVKIGQRTKRPAPKP